MYRITRFLLPLLLTAEVACSQDSLNSSFPDGIYYTLKDFTDKKPNTLSGIRKLNFTLPTSKAFMDTLTDHVWFLNKDNDRIEKIFAVVYQGEIYLHEYGMKKNGMPNFSKLQNYNKYKLHRVLDRGHYFYGIRQYPVSNSTYAILLGSQFGAIGGLVGGMIDVESTTGMYAEYPFIFDSILGKYIMMNLKSTLQQFMDTFFPEDQFKVSKGKLDMIEVRQLFISLNSR